MNITLGVISYGVASSVASIAAPVICSKPEDPSDSFTIVAIFVDASNAQITLAATDVNPTGAYNGMMLYIVSGLGAGQFGVISAFDAIVTKPSPPYVVES